MIGNIEAIQAVEDKLSNFDQKMREYGIDLMNSPEVEEMLARMNVDQLNEGRRADGSQIEPAYARATVEIKKEKGQEYNFVNLRDTEAFQKGIRGRAQRTQITFESTDPKSDELKEKYDDTIFGIAEDNLELVRDFLKPKFFYFARTTLKI